jgi:hypothetical protein
MMRPYSIGAIVRHADGRTGVIVLGPYRAPVGARWVSFDKAGDSAALFDKAVLRQISKRQLARMPRNVD